MQKIIALALSGLSWVALLAPAPASAHIFDVNQDHYVSYQAMIDDLSRARLVFIGELHDDSAHHRAQLQIIRSLHEAGVSLAIGLEMFRHSSQPALDRWVHKTISEKEFLPIYNDNWSYWPLYRDIYRYARQKTIPMLGLNIKREITEQVARAGFSSLSVQQRGSIPLVRCDVDQKYQAYIRRVLGDHFHGDLQFRNFCEAQMVWDAVMAKNLIEYLDRHPKRSVVVLAGSGHAWKFGIPEQIRRHLDIPMRVVLPEIPGRISLDTVTSREADYLLIAPDQGPLH